MPLAISMRDLQRLSAGTIETSSHAVSDLAIVRHHSLPVSVSERQVRLFVRCPQACDLPAELGHSLLERSPTPFGLCPSLVQDRDLFVGLGQVQMELVQVVGHRRLGNAPTALIPVRKPLLFGSSHNDTAVTLCPIPGEHGLVAGKHGLVARVMDGAQGEDFTSFQACTTDQ
ncbi:hypothetical protein SAMN02799636_05945 [Methylobacterium sp. 275MFSha3.1]|nr:hypothetical protein SAMN02799636_05945 [Methylobacterium sp. 275MFSha3.1]